MSLMEYIANRIRELRTRYGGEGISQEALAKAIGVTTNTISRWETGTYKPSIEDLDKLARFLGVSILTFFPQEEQPQREPMGALLRAAQDLPDEDIEELERYAEFRRARHMMKNDKVAPGRKRKGAS